MISTVLFVFGFPVPAAGCVVSLSLVLTYLIRVAYGFMPGHWSHTLGDSIVGVQMIGDWNQIMAECQWRKSRSRLQACGGVRDDHFIAFMWGNRGCFDTNRGCIFTDPVDNVIRLLLLLGVQNKGHIQCCLQDGDLCWHGPICERSIHQRVNLQAKVNSLDCQQGLWDYVPREILIIKQEKLWAEISCIIYGRVCQKLAKGWMAQSNQGTPFFLQWKALTSKNVGQSN